MDAHKVISASWRSRFWAWLIDILLMCILWYLVMFSQRIDPSSIAGLSFFHGSTFLYWTLLEGYRGQSLGKLVLNIAVMGPVGERIGFKDAAIESFGKAFLLPLDILLGWLVCRESRQRLFNRFSNTVVACVNEEVAWCPFRP